MLEQRKEELKKMSCEQLRQYCKEHGIQSYSHERRLKKSELIENILGYEFACPTKEDDEKSQENETLTCNVQKKEQASGENVKKTVSDIGEQCPGTGRYIKNIKVGALIAFRENENKLNTAKVVRVSFKREKIKAVTQYGKEFIISFDDVMWVRTKNRWPAFIMSVLKEQTGRA